MPEGDTIWRTARTLHGVLAGRRVTRGVNPFERVGDLDGTRLDRLIEAARRAMQRNLGPGMRRTRPVLSRERLSVYGRSGKPCLRCGSPVQRRLQGEQARSTYWCPVCQPSSPQERAAQGGAQESGR
jgi:endonuclease-8